MGTDDNLEVFEDVSFVTGDSPVTHNLNAVLGRNAQDVSITNDGPGDMLVATSTDGTVFGGDATRKASETLVLERRNIHSVRITWVSNSSYRVVYA